MRNTRGFTLVELLVVIAIVALLFALLLPTFSGIQVIEDRTHCQKNLVDIGKWFNSYATMNGGRYPYPVDNYYGSKFSGVWVSADPWAGLTQVNQLKQVGAKPESFWCPFDPSYGDYKTWQAESWTKPVRQTNSNGTSSTAYVYIGYTFFIYRGYPYGGKFVDGRYTPTSDSADDDMPIAADNLHYRANGSYTHGWYHGGGLTSSNSGPGLFNSGCNTIFRGGEVVYTDAKTFDWDRPALIHGSCRDMWWFALSPGDVPVVVQ